MQFFFEVESFYTSKKKLMFKKFMLKKIDLINIC